MRGVSTMYRVAICDDEDKQREIVRGLLTALSIKVNIDFEIEEFSSGSSLSLIMSVMNPLFTY